MFNGMVRYMVGEIGSGGDGERCVETLAGARIVAQRLARKSDRPIVIRLEDTRREIARYEPPKATESTEVNAVLEKLQGATERMRVILQQQQDKLNSKGKR